ncbi:MAG: hypothetical protein OEU26_31195, partial [Candidatus Tectomicrobia bacterium]|nr:hypothetical protein [Candidatus Tectomicrobia bacterium]
DTDEALVASWLADRQLLQTAGYHVAVLRETAAFVEAVVLGDWGQIYVLLIVLCLKRQHVDLTLYPPCSSGSMIAGLDN